MISKASIKICLKFVLKFVNNLFPKKKNKVFMEGSPTAESSAVSVSNYIAENYDMDLVYVISDKKYNVSNILHESIRTVNKYSGSLVSLSYIKEFITSRFIFYTHGTFIENNLNRQITTNIWHGITYKKVGVMIGAKPFKVNVTVGTSKKTQEMFSEIFGVDKNKIFISGYPRNDYLINNERENIINRINPSWINKKVIFWLPTFRKNKFDDNQMDGKEVGNPFFIENFNLDGFNDLLTELNAVCLLKPHPNSPTYEIKKGIDNVHIINDHWINNFDLTLYQFMSVTDLLISDVSSVMLDYLFVNKPIICMSSDLEQYDKTRGFYFDDIEKWVPGPIIEEQNDLFSYLKEFLKSGEDEYEEKRTRLRKIFFKFYDNKSTERLVEHVLKDNCKKPL